MHQAGEVEVCIVLALARENSQSVAQQDVCCFTATTPLEPLGYVPAIGVCVQSSFLGSVHRDRLPGLFGWRGTAPCKPSPAPCKPQPSPMQSMGKISPLYEYFKQPAGSEAPPPLPFLGLANDV